MSNVVDNYDVVDNSVDTDADIFIHIEVEETGLTFRGRDRPGQHGDKYAWVCQIQGDDGVATVKGLLSLVPFRKRHYEAIDAELRRRGFKERVYRRYRNGEPIERRRKL